MGYNATLLEAFDGTLMAVWKPTCYRNNHFGLGQLLKQLPRPKEVDTTDGLVFESEHKKKRGENHYLLCQLEPEVMDKEEWDAYDQKTQCNVIFSDSRKVIVDRKPVWLRQETVA
jgi:hypothetical protein